MIVRTLSEAEKTERKVISPDGNWDSVRLLLADDKMGFSFHITTIYKGADFRMHYTNHLESVYCISGKGEIKNLENGDIHPIQPGTIYVLNKHDPHILRAFEEMQMACVFNPAVTGTEVHNKDGAYELNTQSLEPT